MDNKFTAGICRMGDQWNTLDSYSEQPNYDKENEDDFFPETHHKRNHSGSEVDHTNERRKKHKTANVMEAKVSKITLM